MTINNSMDFKVLKQATNKQTGEMAETKKWVHMDGNTANLYRLTVFSKSIIKKYMVALTKLDNR